MDDLKSWLPAIVPGIIFVAIPFWQWLFTTRLARREDVDAAIKDERDARETAMASIIAAQAETTKSLAALHTDYKVLVERLSSLPTNSAIAAVSSRLDHLTGLLQGKLGEFDHVRNAVARHDDIIADAARSALKPHAVGAE